MKRKIGIWGAREKLQCLKKATNPTQSSKFCDRKGQPSKIFATNLQLAQALGEIRLGVKNRVRQILLQARVLGDQFVEPLHIRAHCAQRRVQLLGLQVLLLGAGDGAVGAGMRGRWVEGAGLGERCGFGGGVRCR